MTNGKLTVEAIGVPVVTDIVAQPGDTLLIVQGVCVGVQKATSKVTVRQARPARVTERPITSDLFSDDTATRAKRAEMAAVEQKVIGIIRENGPMDARRILDRMQLDDAKERRLVGQKIWRMLQQGMLRRASGEQHKKQPKMIPA